MVLKFSDSALINEYVTNVPWQLPHCLAICPSGTHFCHLFRFLMAQSQNQYQPVIKGDKHKHMHFKLHILMVVTKKEKYKPFQQGHKQQLMVVKQDS